MTKALKKLKEGKIVGLNEIPGEVWKWGGREVEEWACGFCNKVWNGEEWPEVWRERVIVPIVKKGEGKEVENYRGVTIMPALYKAYIMVLAERLKEEVASKKIIPQNQAGFREGMGTMDIYAMNYLISRQVKRGGGKIVVVLVDLKAAFDTVDRSVLLRTMRKKRIRRGLIGRVEEVLRETRCRVKVQGEMRGKFWMERGVRQGSSMSPLLFNLLIADLEEIGLVN